MQQSTLSLRLKKFLVLCLPIIVAVVVWLIYYASTFHVISITPATNNIATVTPSLTVNFSQNIVNSSLKVVAQSSFISNTTIHGKAVTFTLNAPLQAGQTYTVTIASVANQKGKVLQNIVLSFKPKVVPFDQLPASEQTEILNNQAKAPSRQTTVFFGTDSLIDHGLSSQQAQYYQQAVSNYVASLHTNLTGAVIDPGSIAQAPLDGSGLFRVKFSVTINTQKYSAAIAYSGLSDAELFLYSPSTQQQVFDSGDLGASQ